MRELDEALMDRTTASLNRRQKISSIKASTIFIEKDSTFVIRDVDPQSGAILDPVEVSLTESEMSEGPKLQNDEDKINGLPDSKQSVQPNALLRNTLDCKLVDTNYGAIKRIKNGQYSSSTNVTGPEGEIEEQIRDSQEALTPGTVN